MRESPTGISTLQFQSLSCCCCCCLKQTEVCSGIHLHFAIVYAAIVRNDRSTKLAC